MSGRLCTVALGIALSAALSGCGSDTSSTPPPTTSVDASGKPTPEAIAKATPPEGKKGAGAPIMPGR